MNTDPEKPIDFTAWRDIEPPPDFTANVLRRMRSEPVARSGWRDATAFWMNSRLAYGAALAASLAVAALTWQAAGPSHGSMSLESRSLFAAYARAAGGH